MCGQMAGQTGYRTYRERVPLPSQRLACFAVPSSLMAAVLASGVPALATSQSVTEYCSYNISVPVSLDVGDSFTITIHPTSDCAGAGTFAGSGPSPQGVGVTTYGVTGTENALPYNSGTVSVTNGDRIVYDATAEGSIQIKLTSAVSAFDVTYYDITVAPPSGGSAPSDVRRDTLADIVQQVPQPTTGCQHAGADFLNWSLSTHGGWASSWATWPNGGRGGAVCTRTLTYADGRWSVQ